jgi:Tfp pilus assembly protein PilF
MALQNTGDLGAAVDAYQHAVDLNPADPDARNNLGTMLVKTRRADEGIAQFQKILDADPSYNMARVNLGFACIQKGDLDKAVEQLREAIRREPDWPARITTWASR